MTDDPGFYTRKIEPPEGAEDTPEFFVGRCPSCTAWTQPM